MKLTRQQKQIVDAGTTISLDRPTDQDKAFLARQLVQTTLPHADPGNVPVWSRSNGNLTLTIQQGYDSNGTAYGHPYGIIPRLLMYWMTTEAIRTKTPRGILNSSRLLPPWWFVHTGGASAAKHFVDLVRMHFFLDDKVARIVFQQHRLALRQLMQLVVSVEGVLFIRQ